MRLHRAWAQACSHLLRSLTETPARHDRGNDPEMIRIDHTAAEMTIAELEGVRAASNPVCVRAGATVIRFVGAVYRLDNEDRVDLNRSRHPFESVAAHERSGNP